MTTTKRWLVIFVAVVLTLAAILYVLLSVITPSPTVENAHAAQRHHRHHLSYDRRVVLTHREHHAWQRHHMHKARHLRRKLHGREVKHVSWSKLVRGWPSPKKASHCYKAGGRVDWHTGPAPMFSNQFDEPFCWRHGKITRVKSWQVDSNVTPWGEFVNWDYEGIVGSRGHYEHHHRVHKAWVEVKWHRCTPIYVGCIFGNDIYSTVHEKLKGDGESSFKFH